MHSLCRLSKLSLKVGEGGIGWHIQALFTRRSPVQLKHVLCKIDADNGNLLHGCPKVFLSAKRNAATVSDLAECFDKEHIAVRLKSSTAKEYRGNLRRFILPALGRLAVPEITRADVAKFHHDLRHIPYQATRCLEVVSKMFVLAEMWGALETLRPSENVIQSADTARCTIVHISGNDFL